MFTITETISICRNATVSYSFSEWRFITILLACLFIKRAYTSL